MNKSDFKSIFYYFLFIYFFTVLPFNSYAEITAQDIPDGYQFPSPREEVQGWSDHRDKRAARTHAWYLWEGMSQPSKYKDDNGHYLPIWETWYSTNELFSSKNKKSVKNMKYIYHSRKYAPRTLMPPSQFHSTENSGQILSFNKFNPTAAFFILKPHKQWGKTFQYNDISSLTALNKMFNKNNAPVRDRTINQFPPRSIETKPVFMLVKSKGLTAIPYWQGPQNSITPTNPVPPTWINCVLFDPSSKTSIRPASSKQIKSAKKNMSKNSSCKSFLYAGISQIYHYQLKTDADVKGFNSNQGSSATKG